MILVTGGAGFIGANFVLDWLADRDEPVLNVDKLTYAGNRDNLASLGGDARHVFVHGDICDLPLMAGLMASHRPRAIVHFAAESHVDRSISGPAEFIRTNIEGTFLLLQAARDYLETLGEDARRGFRFLHVSTDEVYGSLESGAPAFRESDPYRPNNPYSASKAAADHLVRAWHRTYAFPALTTHCSNNFGPFQFPEKLIPLCIGRALAGRPIPVFGDGGQIRDWLYVGDHCAALRAVLDHGVPGETYNIGGGNELANIEVVHRICRTLTEMTDRRDGPDFESLISFVTDRPGHDRRYAIDSGRMLAELGWRPGECFDSALRKTVAWYLAHGAWAERIASGAYRDRATH